MRELPGKLEILLRAELTLARLHARRAATRSTLVSIALIFLFITIVMLNVAYWYALAELGRAAAALIVALSNAAVAIMVLSLARRIRVDPSEEAMIREIRSLAMSGISQDLDRLARQVQSLGREVNLLRGLAGSVSRGLGSVLMGLARRRASPHRDSDGD